MNVPTYLLEAIVDEKGFPTDGFSSFLRDLLQNMRISIGEEGYLAPSVSSEPGSASTPEAPSLLSEIQVLEASYKSPTTAVNNNTVTVTVGVQVGTIIFDPYEQNGGVLPHRNGQLKVFLADNASTGTFHAITNT